MSTTGKVAVDPEALRARLGVTSQELEGILPELEGDPADDEGMDPADSAAVRDQADTAKDRIKKAKRTSRTGADGGDDLDEEDERGGEGVRGVNTDTSEGKGGGSLSEALGGASQNALSPFMSAMSAQQANPYANGYLPTPATATQFDVNNAPNRAALAEAIYQAANTGNYGTGAAGDDRPRAGGGSVNVNATEDRDRAFQELADKLVNMEPPIPYAWGGGHGGEPGPGQGISDGGGQADKMGDYNKVGLDCSGLARYMVSEVTGQDSANGTSEAQYSMGQPVSAEEARPGDLVFPESSGRPPMHVAVYVGDGKMIEAQQSGTDLMISDCPPAEFRRF